jgi:hypothetical protein
MACFFSVRIEKGRTTSWTSPFPLTFLSSPCRAFPFPSSHGKKLKFYIALGEVYRIFGRKTGLLSRDPSWKKFLFVPSFKVSIANLYKFGCIYMACYFLKIVCKMVKRFEHDRVYQGIRLWARIFLSKHIILSLWHLESLIHVMGGTNGRMGIYSPLLGLGGTWGGHVMLPATALHLVRLTNAYWLIINLSGIKRYCALEAMFSECVFDNSKVRYSEGSIFRSCQPLSVLLPVISSIIVNLSSLVGHYAMNYETGYSHVITVTDVNNIINYFVPVALL